MIMSREVAGDETTGRLTAYSTEVWLVWDTPRRGTTLAQHSEPSPKLSFAVAGTPIRPLQTSSISFTQLTTKRASVITPI